MFVIHTLFGNIEANVCGSAMIELAKMIVNVGYGALLGYSRSEKLNHERVGGVSGRAQESQDHPRQQGEVRNILFHHFPPEGSMSLFDWGLSDFGPGEIVQAQPTETQVPGERPQFLGERRHFASSQKNRLRR